MFPDLLGGSTPLTKQTINLQGADSNAAADSSGSDKPLFFQGFFKQSDNSVATDQGLTDSIIGANGAVNAVQPSGDLAVSALFETLEAAIRSALTGKTIPLEGNDLPTQLQSHLPALPVEVFDTLTTLASQLQHGLKNNTEVSNKDADALSSVNALLQSVNQLVGQLQLPQSLAARTQSLNNLADQIASLKESIEKNTTAFPIGGQFLDITSQLGNNPPHESLPLLPLGKENASLFADLNGIQTNKADIAKFVAPLTAYNISTNADVEFSGKAVLGGGVLQEKIPSGLQNQINPILAEKLNLQLNTVAEVSDLSLDKVLQVKGAPSLDAKLAAFGELLQQNIQRSLQVPTQSNPQVGQSFTGQINLPVANPQWGNQFAQRLSWIASQGITTAELQLNPAELGPLHVRIESAENAARVSFAVQHPATREALESQLPKLRDMFSGQGLDLIDIENHSFTREESNQSQNEEYFDGENTENSIAFDDAGESTMAALGEGIQSGSLTLHYGLVDLYA